MANLKIYYLAVAYKDKILAELTKQGGSSLGQYTEEILGRLSKGRLVVPHQK